MSYADRPWVKYYDPGVDAEVDVPEITLVDRFEDIVSRFGKRPALHFFGVTLTYEELDGLANRFANALIQAGCGRGDVVAICLPNIPQYVIAQIGAAKAGCAASGVSPLLAPGEFSHQLNDSKAKSLVTLDAIFCSRLPGLVDDLPHLRQIVATNIVDFLPPIKRTLARWLRKVPCGKVEAVPGRQVIGFNDILSRFPREDPGVSFSPDDTCLVQYTGGTTGLPKGTVLTHRNMITNLDQIETWVSPRFGEEVALSGFPLFHLAGLILCLTAISMGAAQILIPDPRNTKHIVKEMVAYRPTFMANVPSLYMMLMDDPAFHRLDFSRLDMCISGASAFPVEAIRRLESIIGVGKVLEVYGMTETSPIVTMNPRRGPKRVGTVGLPIPGTAVRIMDLETGLEDVPLGDEGEVVVSGGQVMKGYLNKPDETAIALREHDGSTWLHTGDVGRMDEDGFLTIVDRAKDMLSVGGFKVFSREVEEKLYEHPAIEFCAIIGEPNPKRPGSELVKLVVQPTAGYKTRDPERVKDDILSFAREQMAPYKVPKSIEFIDEMPLTQVGKVDKKRLRARGVGAA